ncbi:Protein of unknown function [Bacillus wiedmannii]|nr:Protein of unknown function [Bacillus wiedmannii]
MMTTTVRLKVGMKTVRLS